MKFYPNGQDQITGRVTGLALVPTNAADAIFLTKICELVDANESFDIALVEPVNSEQVREFRLHVAPAKNQE